MSRILIVTGEASGDLHGAHLALALKKIDPTVQILGVGGHHMALAGVELLPGITRIDAIGLVGFSQIRAGLANLLFLRSFLKHNSLDAVVCIDSPGFNLRLARIAHNLGHRVIYYIAPQIWAWAGRRIKLIKRVVHHVIVILPFEEPLYRQAGVPCTFVGHPLLDSMTLLPPAHQLEQTLGLTPSRPILGLLPGSRETEVQLLLPVMLETAEALRLQYPDLQCIIGQAPSISQEQLQEVIGRFSIPAKILPACPNEVMSISDVLLVASGTATLQAALVGTPMVMIYRVSRLTYAVSKLVLKVPFIGLVNLVAGKKVVTELLQDEVVSSRLKEEVLRIFNDKDFVREMKANFQSIRELLGSPGASERAAKIVLDECQA
jgi:lipid-A-disaccharide synthase